MYEPLYSPVLDQGLQALSHVRFGISHCRKFLRRNDPDVERLHLHGYPEIFFNVSSEVSFFVGDRLYPVRHGDAVISRANDIHVCIFNESCLHEYFCLWVEAEEGAPLLSFLQEAGSSPLLSFDEDVRKQLHGLLTSLAEATPSPATDLERGALLLQILLLLKQRSASPPSAAPLPPALRDILEDTRVRFAEIRSVSELPSAQFISPATLNRWFRKYTHASPREYLESQRLAHAVKLLLDGATVTDACLSSGFSDCSHFIALFKRKFGVTPLQYKRTAAKP